MKTKAIIGLGNLDPKYDNTRHNAGFEVVDSLAVLKEIGAEKFALNKRLHAQIALSIFIDIKLYLAKPITYMNESGKAALAIKNFYKIDFADLLIVHDDVSLPLGKIRLQKEGGAGGQHGVESIINCFSGQKGFSRLKIGIGPDPGGDLRSNYVLQKFSKNEREILGQILELATRACFMWLTNGIDQTMNEFNGLDLLSK